MNEDEICDPYWMDYNQGDIRMVSDDKPFGEVLNSIGYIVIKSSSLERGPVTWEVNMNGKDLKFTDENLESVRRFKKEYTRAFNHRAPCITGREWLRILDVIRETRLCRVIQVDESHVEQYARLIFDWVCMLPITNVDMSVGGNGLYEHLGPDGKTYYCMTVSNLNRLVTFMGIEIDYSMLDHAMDKLGFKIPGAHVVDFGRDHSYMSVMCFYPEAYEKVNENLGRR